MDIHSIESSWRDHYAFAVWLVNYIKPNITVDLGVYHGFSTFSFASPGYGRVLAVDNFQIKNSYQMFMKNLSELGIDNVDVYHGDFDSIEDYWETPIDILHIDGDHSYKAVRNDFDKWSRHVTRCIMLHDVANPCFDGPIKVFQEELGEYYGVLFYECNGLGVLTKDKKLLKAICRKFDIRSIKKADYKKTKYGMLLRFTEEK